MSPILRLTDVKGSWKFPPTPDPYAEYLAYDHFLGDWGGFDIDHHTPEKGGSYTVNGVGTIVVGNSTYAYYEQDFAGGYKFATLNVGAASGIVQVTVKGLMLLDTKFTLPSVLFHFDPTNGYGLASYFGMGSKSNSIGIMSLEGWAKKSLSTIVNVTPTINQWYTIKIVYNSDASSCEFYLDDVYKGVVNKSSATTTDTKVGIAYCPYYTNDMCYGHMWDIFWAK
jgi:hypothetical protein